MSRRAKRIINRIQYEIGGESYGRVVRIKEYDWGGVNIWYDFHGLGKQEAERHLKTIISVNRGEFKISAVHGFNHGTVIRDMIREENVDQRITKKIPSSNNDGLTYIWIKSVRQSMVA